ncbi:MAG: zf-HC2 domain-containing protein [Acidobacteriota bacterium]|nr:zf-HC2 domain-containing protein [Acidobacteriota bacterium]
MYCQDFSLMYSAQVDGYAEEREQVALQKHLRECAACRRRAAELRNLRSELQALEMPAPPKSKTKLDLAMQIQGALRVEARAHEKVKRSRADLIELWRMRLFTQGIGAVVSLAMFLVILSGVMQPAFRTLALAQAVRDVLTGNEDSLSAEAIAGIQFKMAIYQPPPPPVFAPSGELLHLGASLSEEDEIIVTLNVRKDGRASINELVANPDDPAMIDRFSNAITERASFQPTRRQQSTSVEAVVILSKVDIKASLIG